MSPQSAVPRAHNSVVLFYTCSLTRKFPLFSPQEITFYWRGVNFLSSNLLHAPSSRRPAQERRMCAHSTQNTHFCVECIPSLLLCAPLHAKRMHSVPRKARLCTMSSPPAVPFKSSECLPFRCKTTTFASSEFQLHLQYQVQCHPQFQLKLHLHHQLQLEVRAQVQTQLHLRL